MSGPHASPSAAVEPGRAYVHFGSAGTACLDAETGKILWKRDDLPCDHWRGPGHNGIFSENGVDWLVYHAYDTEEGGISKLRIEQITWDAEGWPHVASYTGS